MNNRSFGTLGEERAKEYLEHKGYRILDCNYRVGRLGEIDIVARDNDTLCFIEVKTRSNNRFGTPAQAVMPQKQATIIKIAQIYMQKYKYYDIPVRFDIVEIFMDREGNTRDVNLLKNAF
ncbi:MAG: YraN family protein [Acetivibrionales bacterium]|jgi:putative endonuclease|nr:YraN family protein [Clostridiaceae bacterium]